METGFTVTVHAFLAESRTLVRVSSPFASRGLDDVEVLGDVVLTSDAVSLTSRETIPELA